MKEEHINVSRELFSKHYKAVTHVVASFLDTHCKDFDLGPGHIDHILRNPEGLKITKKSPYPKIWVNMSQAKKEPYFRLAQRLYSHCVDMSFPVGIFKNTVERWGNEFRTLIDNSNICVNDMDKLMIWAITAPMQPNGFSWKQNTRSPTSFKGVTKSGTNKIEYLLGEARASGVVFRKDHDIFTKIDKKLHKKITLTVDGHIITDDANLPRVVVDAINENSYTYLKDSNIFWVVGGKVYPWAQFGPSKKELLHIVVSES